MKNQIKLTPVWVAAITVAVLIGSSATLVYSLNAEDQFHSEGIVTSSAISGIAVNDSIEIMLDNGTAPMEIVADGLVSLVDVTSITEESPLLIVEGMITESEIDGFGIGDVIECVTNSNTMEITCTNVTADTSATGILE